MTHPRSDDASADKIRRRIAEEAARIMARGGDSQRARFRAARRVAGGWVPEEQLPIHDAHRPVVSRETGDQGGQAHLAGDRFDRIADIVRMLSAVRQDPAKHPEGDALEHSLQVFDRVHEECPFDEELLTAALVHDVGRAIDRSDPVTAGVAALGDLITPRTRWLMENLHAGWFHAAGTLGLRARHRLEQHPDFLDVLLLAESDRRGRIRGYASPSLDEAIVILRALDADNDAR